MIRDLSCMLYLIEVEANQTKWLCSSCL